MEEATNKEAADTMLSLEQEVAKRVLGIVMDAAYENPVFDPEISKMGRELRNQLRYLARQEALSVTRAMLSDLETKIINVKNDVY